MNANNRILWVNEGLLRVQSANIASSFVHRNLAFMGSSILIGHFGRCHFNLNKNTIRDLAIGYSSSNINFGRPTKPRISFWITQPHVDCLR